MKHHRWTSQHADRGPVRKLCLDCDKEFDSARDRYDPDTDPCSESPEHLGYWNCPECGCRVQSKGTTDLLAAPSCPDCEHFRQKGVPMEPDPT